MKPARLPFSTMTSRERMLAAISHQPVDRVPTDIWATPEVWRVLRAHVGEGVDVLDALGIDGFAGVGPRYCGPALPPGTDHWGISTRRVDYGTGTYDEQTYIRWRGATIDDLNASHSRARVVRWMASPKAGRRVKRMLRAGTWRRSLPHLLRGQGEP
jgi:hypothetical protein